MFRQSIHRFAQLPMTLILQHHLLRIRQIAWRRRHIQWNRRSTRPHPSPEFIQTNSINPTREETVRAICWERAERSNERLLNGVLGFNTVFQKTECESKKLELVSLKNLVECRRIAFPAAHSQE